MPTKEEITAKADQLHDAVCAIHPGVSDDDVSAITSAILNTSGLCSALLVKRAELTFDTGFMRFVSAMMEANARELARKLRIVIE